MPEGGTISISADSVALDTANAFSLPAGEYVRISFADTGCGMPDEVQKRIFDPYFTTKPKGSGLGLASAYSIIARHGGHISVRSHPGQGSTFEILLPAIRQPAPGPGSSDLPMTPGSPGVKSVLVMDDEEIIRDVASNMLIELGYRVQTCAGGDEAYALYKAARDTKDPFWAVIMDLTIPGGMGGIEAAQLILAIDPEACLIVSSGYSNDPVMSEFRAYGFSGAVAKPYSIQEISSVLAGLRQNPRASR
jgi:CheY-like chemotaxis protein